MTRVAAIDCGTNTIRLLIADARASSGGAVRLVPLVRLNEIVRLGQGVDRTGRLDEAALERTLAVVGDYADRCRELGAQSVRFVATSATRDASNRAVFVEGVRELLGVEPEVVSGQEEARLSFAGSLLGADGGGAFPGADAGHAAAGPAGSEAATAGPETGAVGPTGLGDAAGPEADIRPGAGGTRRLVTDLGGGSTELVLGVDAPAAAYSMNTGSVRVTERYLADGVTPASEAAHWALSTAWDTEAVNIGQGGSIPFIATLKETFPDAQVLVTGIEDPDTRAHSENESMHLGELERIVVAEALLLARLGDAMGS